MGGKMAKRNDRYRGYVVHAALFFTLTSLSCIFPWVSGFTIRQKSFFSQSINPSSSSLESSCRRLRRHHQDQRMFHRRQQHQRLKATSNQNDKSNDDKLTNAERERREEEKRRKERKDDVVIGGTSAKRGEQDYPLNPEATREEWLRQATLVERQVFRLTEDGMDALNSLQLHEANKAFDEVFRLKPDAYLWQAGIVKFYLGDLVGAASIFARNAKTFEQNPIMGPATEERIWRDASQLMFLTSLSVSERKRIIRSEPDSEDGINSVFPQIIEDEDDDDDDEDDDDDDDPIFSMSSEPRKVFRLARDLFSSSVASDSSAEAFARGQLLSIGGSYNDIADSKQDKKMRKLTAWFYLGLHYDVTGQKDEAVKCMKMALHLTTSGGKSADIVQTLPLLHMTARDWFDDDDFDDDPLKEFDGENEDGVERNIDTDGSSSAASSSAGPKKSTKTKGLFLDEYESDPVLEATVIEGLSKMTVLDLRDALRIRGLKIRGSKQELIDRLFYSMMDDSGYKSGFAP
jgi:tetratricopeptide (TPR) repeat protein